MEPRAVVEALDVLEHAAARLRPGIEGEVIEPLGLQGMEEALRRCIVETIAGPAHAADHPVLIEELLVVGARVGSAAIAVMHEAGRGATPRDGAVQRLLHEPELHFRSFAKYAKAFFKMSRSWVTSRSFCSRSRTRRACGARRPRPGNASVGVSVSCSRHRCSRLRAIPRCVATSVNDFPSSTTRWTASFLNCGVKVRRTRIVRLPMDHLVRASHGSYLGVHFSGELQPAVTRGY